LKAEDAPDSFNVLPALFGESKTGRDRSIEHAGVLSLRQGPWKFIEPGKGPKNLVNTNTESGQSPAGQFFNLAEDLGETRNLAAEQPDKARELANLLAKLPAQGRSR
jgi:arylsulfatase A-like enzyme